MRSRPFVASIIIAFAASLLSALPAWRPFREATAASRWKVFSRARSTTGMRAGVTC